MKNRDIILGGIAGTTAFTLFSYCLAELSGRKFKQPELIGKMIKRTSIDVDEQTSQFTGWLMHYAIGMGFAAAYKQLVDTTGIKPSVANGIIAGAVSGFPAALTWHTSLHVHPAPPRKQSWDYYAELFVGHVIFGAACFLAFGSSRKKISNGEARTPASGSIRQETGLIEQGSPVK